MARATASNAKHHTVESEVTPSPSSCEDRVVYFHEEYDNSGGAPRVVFAADSPPLDDGPHEYTASSNCSVDDSAAAEIERHNIIAELKRLEILEEEAMQIEDNTRLNQTSIAKATDPDFDIVGMRSKQGEESDFGSGLATGFLNRARKATPKKLSSRNTCQDSIQSPGTQPNLQKAHGAPNRTSKKRVSFAEPCVSSTEHTVRSSSEADPSKSKEDFTTGDRLQSGGQTRRRPATVVWNTSNCVLGQNDNLGMTQPGLLEAIEDAANDDEDSEPSGRLAFIENLLKLEAEEEHIARRDGNGTQALDTFDSDFDEADSREEAFDAADSNIAISDTERIYGEEFGTGFISGFLEPARIASGISPESENDSKSSILTLIDSGTSIDDTDSVSSVLSPSNVAGRNDAGGKLVDCLHLGCHAAHEVASCPSSLNPKIEQPHTGGLVATSSAFDEEQSQTSLRHQEKVDSLVTGPQDNIVLDQEPLSDVVVERSAISRRSRRKRPPRTQVGSPAVLVVDDISSGPVRGSLAVPEEADAIFIDEDQTIPKPRSRFKAFRDERSKT